ncbi:MAG: putative Ig domain-containing protein [Candidatus Nitrotoga sp.]
MKKIMVLLSLLALSSTAQASTSYGSLGNFDVVNDTGETAYGFEIEIDDVHSKDIGGTYSYNHYGVPNIREDSADPAHPKVFIRYERPAGTTSGIFTGFTTAAIPGAISPTSGHQCTNPSVNQGCEHFGVGVYQASYTAVRYHWLIKDATGNTITGPAVNVSTPNWNYSPPVIAPPQPNVPPIVLFPAKVIAVIPAPVVPIPAKQYGEPSWVKVIKTKTHKVRPLKLEDLVNEDKDGDGHPDWTNGEPDEVESEWYLLQTNTAGNNKKDELEGGADDMGDKGEEVVTRRYEFYDYVAGDLSIDGENGEAMCDEVATDNIHGVNDSVEVTDANGDSYLFDCTGVAIVGAYRGAQMGEFNAIAPLDMIDAVQGGNVAQAFPQRRIPFGGNTPYQTVISEGALPNGLSIDSETGILSGTPEKVGVSNFKATTTDSDGTVVTKSYTLKVTGPGDVDGDNDIDSADLNVIKAKYGQAVAANDPADLNGDLKINILDYRKAASLCTLPRCALVTPTAP